VTSANDTEQQEQDPNVGVDGRISSHPSSNNTSPTSSNRHVDTEFSMSGMKLVSPGPRNVGTTPARLSGGGGRTNKKKTKMTWTIPSPSRSTLDPEYARRLYPQDDYYPGTTTATTTTDMGLHKQEEIEVGIDGMVVDPPHTNNTEREDPGFFTPDTSLIMEEDAMDYELDNSNIAGTTSPTNYYTPERNKNTNNRTPASNRRRMDSYTHSYTPNPFKSSEGYTPKNTQAQSYYTPQRSPTKHANSPFRHHLLEGPTSPSSVERQRRWKQSQISSKNEFSYTEKTSTYSDRFIPSRVTSNLQFSVWEEEKEGNHSSSHPTGSSSNVNGENSIGGSGSDGTTTGSEGEVSAGGEGGSSTGNGANGSYPMSQPPLLDVLLRSELLGENVDPASYSTNISMNAGINGGGAGNSLSNVDGSLNNTNPNSNTHRTPLREGHNFLRFNTNPRQTYLNEVLKSPTSIVESFNLSPVGTASSNRLLSMPQKRKRRIAKVPFKVLDAPQLADDFYLNLVDWSSLNVLAVGLGSCVYLWSACTSQVTKLCDLGSHSQDAITSVAWTQRGTHLAVGVNNGEIQIWDTVKCAKIRTMAGHNARIGALSWSGPTLASGSRDRLIYLRDVRVQQPFTAKLSSHKQEVCGLKWSFVEPAHLASGGNDNKLLVWDIKMHRQPTHRFAEHTAAVKAIAWSPHQHGLLASGGGTADRCIRFWNALSGSAINAIDTGSQVCNLAWSQNCNEIVSTHGYSLNQIAIWKYPNMQKVATLTGHTYRVLYLAMSPDGSTIVTGAGDETLRFWQVFPGPRSHGKNAGNGILFPSSPGSILR